MNDELPPIPDDPQQSFGGEKDRIEHMFTRKGKSGAREWWIVGPGERVGKPHNSPSIHAALEGIEHRIGPVVLVMSSGPINEVRSIDDTVIRSARVGPLGSHPSTKSAT